MKFYQALKDIITMKEDQKVYASGQLYMQYSIGSHWKFFCSIWYVSLSVALIVFEILSEKEYCTWNTSPNFVTTEIIFTSTVLTRSSEIIMVAFMTRLTIRFCCINRYHL